MKPPASLARMCACLVLLFAGAASAAPAAEARFRRGDANADGQVDLGDAVQILNYLFASAAISCVDAADTNDDGQSDIGDPIGLLNYLFVQGSAPPAPGPSECGADPTDDRLTCEAYPPCATGPPGVTRIDGPPGDPADAHRRPIHGWGDRR